MEYPKTTKVTDENIYVCTQKYIGSWTMVEKGQTAVIIKNNAKDDSYLLFIGTSEVTEVDEYEKISEHDLKHHFKHVL